MKSYGVLLSVATLALLSGADAKSAKNQPGWCKDDKDCQKVSKDYVCVSVQTTRSGVELVKQCLPQKQGGDVCAGMQPGLCPSFSTWDKEFQSISSVCAYIVPEAKCSTDPNGKSKKGTVNCLEVKTGKDSDDTEKVIYGCVDYDGSQLLFEQGSDSDRAAQSFDYKTLISENCVNPKSDNDVVCSGRGTCMPMNAGGDNYQCKCNIGYSGKMCQFIENNKCTTDSQCLAGVCNMELQSCECSKGTRGDKCALCDPKSPDACNKKGSCKGNGSNTTCACEDGYAGAHCTRKPQGKQSKKKSSNSSVDDEEDSMATAPHSSTLAVTVTMAFASVLLAAFFN